MWKEGRKEKGKNVDSKWGIIPNTRLKEGRRWDRQERSHDFHDVQFDMLCFL